MSKQCGRARSKYLDVDVPLPGQERRVALQQLYEQARSLFLIKGQMFLVF